MAQTGRRAFLVSHRLCMWCRTFGGWVAPGFGCTIRLVLTCTFMSRHPRVVRWFYTQPTRFPSPLLGIVTRSAAPQLAKSPEKALHSCRHVGLAAPERCSGTSSVAHTSLLFCAKCICYVSVFDLFLLANYSSDPGKLSDGATKARSCSRRANHTTL